MQINVLQKVIAFVNLFANSINHTVLNILSLSKHIVRNK